MNNPIIFTPERIEWAKKEIKSWSSPRFVFLAANTSSPMVGFHGQIEKWIQNIQEPNERKDFISRFTSKDDKAHLSAFFELMWNQYFFEEHWNIERHPLLSNNKKPDFKVTSPNQEFYFEVVTAFPEKVESKNQQALDELLNVLNKVEHYFFVGVHLKSWLPDRYRSSKVRDFIVQELDKLNPETDCQEATKTIEYKEDGVEIDFDIYGKKVIAKHPIIGSVMNPGFSGPVGSDQIKGRLVEKVKKYKDIKNQQKPLVIAVCSDASSIHTDMLEYDLFGRPVLSFSVNGEGPSTWSRDKSGIFTPKKSDLSDPSNTRLSAVIHCRRKWVKTEKFPDGSMGYEILIFHNPWATQPLKFDVFGDKVPQYIPDYKPDKIEMLWKNKISDRVVLFE